jgi:precorrin-6A/cobalt-precorrin-6A reductase
MRLLILGGTGEAAALATAGVARFGGRLEVITSLAGRTRNPATVPGRVRTGGFGGAEGLAEYLAAERIGLVIDATHPFAATISAHAADACARTGTARLVLLREAWRAGPGDRWIEVASVADAAAEIAARPARTFVTVGVKELGEFAACRDAFLLVRVVEPPVRPLPLADCTVVTGRGPFTQDDERRLMEEHRIEVLVSKASGGEGTYGKIAAARALGLPVIMVTRPAPPDGESVGSVDEAMEWIAGLVADS